MPRNRIKQTNKQTHTHTHTVDTVQTPEFRKCLVTESPELPHHLRCEHLTKFILALLVKIRQGVPFTTAELLERMHAFMAEMVGRGSVVGTRLLDLCEGEMVCTDQELLESVSISDAVTVFICVLARMYRVRVYIHVCTC